MRALTFAGFLKNYVRSLSTAETNNVNKLAGEAAHSNPRLREPLLLYAVFSGKTELLLRAVKNPTLYAQYKSLTDRYDQAGFEDALRDTASPLPDEYKKVWTSYLNKKNRLLFDNHSKELMRKKVVALQSAKGVSNYRLYVDLGLNPGNLNAWLKHGNPNKVSLDTARMALKHLETVPPAGGGCDIKRAI